MLEATRKTLVQELDDRFKQLHVLKEFQKLTTEFPELNKANVKTVVGEESEPIESQVVRSLESVLSDVDFLSNSVDLESATPRFQEMKKKLDEVRLGIKEYNPANNGLLSNEDVKSILNPFYADGIFENRTAADLFGFLEFVHTSIYLQSCVNSSNAQKTYKLNFFNEVFSDFAMLGQFK